MSLQSILKPNNYDLFARSLTTASGGSVDFDNIIFHTLTQDNSNSSLNASGNLSVQSLTASGNLTAGDINSSGNVTVYGNVIEYSFLSNLSTESSWDLSPLDFVNGTVFINVADTNNLTITLPSVPDIVSYLGANKVYTYGQFSCDFYYNLKTASGGSYGESIVLGPGMVGFGFSAIGFTQTTFNPDVIGIVNINLKCVFDSPTTLNIFPSISTANAGQPLV